jgi:hypothetical protein
VEHVVFFSSPDGSPAFRRAASLEDAVRLVEHLRNVEGVHQVAVHPLGDEVPLAFRTWYRVEVPASAAPAAEPAAAVPAAVPAVPAVPAVAAPEPVTELAEAPEAAEVPVQEAPEPVGADARSGLTSLGFFAT